ncbi:UNVERIFIED_CONTAM: hypothetical protein PYX00_008560 [Menopon gallinae]|uniref:Secreted protein n=1 Tax=Menopon gallinae TaxID=328185 RepID=A0AAW2HNV8_9NEOP
MRVQILVVALLALLYCASADDDHEYDYDDSAEGEGDVDVFRDTENTGDPSTDRGRRSPPKFDSNAMRRKTHGAKRSVPLSQYFDPAPALLSVNSPRKMP